MKVFVATSKGQGIRPTDFFDAQEGDLVFFVLECDGHVDAECGCRRSFAGVSGATTTFEVEDRDVTEMEYIESYFAGTIKSGRWAEEETEDGYFQKFCEDLARIGGASKETVAYVIENHSHDPKAEARSLLELASTFPLGVVLEKRGDEIYPRIIEVTDTDKVLAMIEQGESTTFEFKESFSLDTKKQTKESYMELSCFKTIAGFLNAKGGSLLVGVADDGKIPGVNREIEIFHRNSDKFLLHFKNLLKSKIGESYYPFIDHRIVKIGDALVLLVECKNSPIPCYLDGKDFYVRTNPATDKLEGREMVDYINHHWKR